MADISPMIQYGIPPAGKTEKTFFDNPRTGVRKTVIKFHEFDLNDEKEFLYSRYEVIQYNQNVEGGDILLNRFQIEYWADNSTTVNYQGQPVPPGSEDSLTEYQFFKYLEANPIVIPFLKEAYLETLYNAGKFDRPKELAKEAEALQNPLLPGMP